MKLPGEIVLEVIAVPELLEQIATREGLTVPGFIWWLARSVDQPDFADIYRAYARLMAAAPELLEALKGLNSTCSNDVLNPCWDNRPTDKPGLHWGSEPSNPVHACAGCIARAAIAKAEGVK